MDHTSSSDPGGSQHQYGEPNSGTSAYKPPPPPPVPRKGFNWLACCGISCAVIVVVCAVVGYLVFNAGKKMVAEFEQIETVAQDVQAASIETIKAEATQTTGDTLSSTPDIYTSSWVELEAEVGQPFDTTYQQQQNVAGTQYYLGNNVIMIDVSSQPSVASTGQKVRAWGRPAVVQMGSIPLVGPLLKLAAQSDPTMPDFSSMVFFYAKKVELIENSEETSINPCEEPVSDESEDRPPKDDSGQDQGWID